MENKIKIVGRVMSFLVILSAMFFLIALKGISSFGGAIVVFMVVMFIIGFVKKKKGVDEREMLLAMVTQYFALLAGVSFILIYLGISLITGIKTDNMLEYALFVYIFSYLPLYRIFGMPRMEL